MNKKVSNPTNIFIDCLQITQVESTKFLGIKIDSSMSWSLHIQYIKSKIAKAVGIISKARNTLSRSSLVTLYYTFIYPYLMYCIEVWGGACNTYCIEVWGGACNTYCIEVWGGACNTYCIEV